MIISFNNLSKHSKTTFLSCFLTLYNITRHESLEKVFFQIIDFCFKGSNKQLIMVGKYGARWIDSEKQGSVTFS